MQWFLLLIHNHILGCYDFCYHLHHSFLKIFLSKIWHTHCRITAHIVIIDFTDITFIADIKLIIVITDITDLRKSEDILKHVSM
jgi:hypothetical protein